MSFSPYQVEYRLVPSYPGYRVGSDGSVWTCKKGRYGLMDTWKQLRAPVNGGYHSVSLMGMDKKSHKFRCGGLVLMAFVGPRPTGFEMCHENGNRADDRLINLRWGTRRSNVEDTIRHGRVPRGEKHANAKITADQVLKLRAARASGLKYREIGEQFNLPMSTIYKAILGTRWRHI
jgi:hypothetical protein